MRPQGMMTAFVLAAVVACGGCHPSMGRANEAVSQPPASATAPKQIREGARAVAHPAVPQPGPAERLVAAVDRGDVAAVRSLLAAGAPVDAVVYREPHTHFTTTALYAAAAARNLRLVRILVAAGADPGMPHPPAQLTPLHAAAGLHDLRIARLLLEAGADPLAAAQHDVTPLSLARERGSAAMVKLLSDPRWKTWRGAPRP